MNTQLSKPKNEKMDTKNIEKKQRQKTLQPLKRKKYKN